MSKWISSSPEAPAPRPRAAAISGGMLEPPRLLPAPEAPEAALEAAACPEALLA